MLVKNEKKRDYAIVLITTGLILIAACGFVAHRLAVVDSMVHEAEKNAVDLGLQAEDSAAILDVYSNSYGDTVEGQRLLQTVRSGHERLKSLQISCENLIDTVEQVGTVERLMIYDNIKTAFDFFAAETTAQRAQFDSMIAACGDCTDSMPPIHLSLGETHLADAK